GGATGLERGRGAGFLAARFPSITRATREHGFDWAREPVPVTPAAHYWMGGIRTDLDGRTSLPGLFAVGEAACTGVHGANRLASNSLLEGLVCGARAAAALDGTGEIAEPVAAGPTVTIDPEVRSSTQVRAEVQRLMWEHVGVEREARGLGEACARLDALEV